MMFAVQIIMLSRPKPAFPLSVTQSKIVSYAVDRGVFMMRGKHIKIEGITCLLMEI